MIRLEHVTKTFKTKDGDVHAVKDVSIHVRKGMIYGIIGFSGAGKSTLVRCMNLLERPDEGKVIFDGEDLMEASPAALRKARQKMGMIFQHFNLLPALTIYDNIALPLKMQKVPKAEIDKKVMELLELIDLVERKDSYPSQLSGGQKQRVAIARALVNDPKVLLCDEATSALDPQTTQTILRLIKRINKERGITVVVITHEMFVVKEICDRVAVMDAGRVVEKGDIVPIFVHPVEQMTKNFIATASNANKIDELIKSDHPLTRLASNQQLARLQYDQTNTTDAIISQVSRLFDVDCSIIFGNVEILHDAPIGTLTVILTGDDANIRKSIDYLRQEGVEVEVIKRGHID
ncbi:ATP-binding cassette domain-containing protein [Erysipelotrichaceae bacterium RD49]|nr:ATP-binding cassette domain-containing protein [Erysipelotrichaceae bacterium RD49]